MGTYEKGIEVLSKTKALIVNTNGLDGYPNTRIFYSHANEGYTLYFSSAKDTAKVKEIAADPKVSAYYENTAQQLETWKNVTVYGDAAPIEANTEDYRKAVRLLSEKSPNFKKRADSGQLSQSILFKVTPKRVKILDIA